MLAKALEKFVLATAGQSELKRMNFHQQFGANEGNRRSDSLEGFKFKSFDVDLDERRGWGEGGV